MSVNFDGVIVKYIKDGVKTEKKLQFNDDFILDINGKKYFSDSGYLYECGTNKEIKVFDFANKNDNATAYQLLGMSCTAESARDYTFSKKDIDQALADSLDESVDQDGLRTSDKRSASVIGTGAGRVAMGRTEYNKGKYTTVVYRSKYDDYNTSTISVWLTPKEN